ncbi:unnamed protein product [Caenorhabditis brenneri]
MDEAPEFDNEEEVETEHYVEDRFGVLAKMEMQMKKQLDEAMRKKERSEASAYRPTKKPFKHNARRQCPEQKELSSTVQETPEMTAEVDVANEREQKDRSTLYPYYPRSMRPSQMRKRTGGTNVTAPSDGFGVVAKRQKIETDKLATNSSSLYPYYPSLREVEEKDRRNAAEISKKEESIPEERDEKSRKNHQEKNEEDAKQVTQNAPSETLEAVEEMEIGNRQSSSHPYYPIVSNTGRPS